MKRELRFLVADLGQALDCVSRYKSCQPDKISINRSCIGLYEVSFIIETPSNLITFNSVKELKEYLFNTLSYDSQAYGVFSIYGCEFDIEDFIAFISKFPSRYIYLLNDETNEIYIFNDNKLVCMSDYYEL